MIATRCSIPRGNTEIRYTSSLRFGHSSRDKPKKGNSNRALMVGKGKDGSASPHHSKGTLRWFLFCNSFSQLHVKL